MSLLYFQVAISTAFIHAFLGFFHQCVLLHKVTQASFISAFFTSEDLGLTHCCTLKMLVGNRFSPSVLFTYL